MKEILSIKKLTKRYGKGENELTAVNKADLSVYEGDFIAIIGQSGSGKTTLLNMIGCIDKPSSGAIELDGENLVDMDDGRLALIRRRKIGYVFQDFKLLPILTAEENIIMPLLLDNKAVDRTYFEELTEELGINKHLKHLPSELSGGQKQRVAIARALITRPSIVLADEPTGNLDKASAEEIMSLLKQLNDSGKTILLVTHNEDFAKMCKRLIRITDGVIAEEKPDKA